MNQNRGSWETCDLRDAAIEPNSGDDAVVLTFSAVDSNGQVGHFVKEIRPLLRSINQGNRSKRTRGLTIQTMTTAIHRARLCTTQAAISTPPVNTGQDLDADSGSGSGGGASAAPTDTSAQAESEFEPTGAPPPGADAGGGGMAIDAPDAHKHEVPIDDESAKLRGGFATLSVKPSVQNHLAVVGVGLASQFDKATRQVPNREYLPVLLEHADGFERVASLLTKNDPRHVGELAYVIGDAEMEPIRALPVTPRAERDLVERRTQGLIGSLVAAVHTGLAFKCDPNVSVYLWGELGKGPGKLSEKLRDTLTDVFRRATRVK